MNSPSRSRQINPEASVSSVSSEGPFEARPVMMVPTLPKKTYIKLETMECLLTHVCDLVGMPTPAFNEEKLTSEVGTVLWQFACHIGRHHQKLEPVIVGRCSPSWLEAREDAAWSVLHALCEATGVDFIDYNLYKAKELREEVERQEDDIFELCMENLSLKDDLGKKTGHQKCNLEG